MVQQSDLGFGLMIAIGRQSRAHDNNMGDKTQMG
jgi:hypothetical protein